MSTKGRIGRRKQVVQMRGGWAPAPRAPSPGQPVVGKFPHFPWSCTELTWRDGRGLVIRTVASALHASPASAHPGHPRQRLSSKCSHFLFLRVKVGTPGRALPSCWRARPGAATTSHIKAWSLGRTDL